MIKKTIRLLIVFAKTPIPGQVKTRIGATVGMNQAAVIYRKMLEITLHESVSNEIWKQMIAITPESDASYFTQRQCNILQQRGEGIGNRMSNMLEQGFQGGADQVMLIGSDCPTLGRAELAEAFLILDQAPAVIGPSADGGFYLFGVTREHYQTAARIFREAIPWSTPQVLSEVQAYCQQRILPLVFVATKRDIDTYEDWLFYSLAGEKQ